MSFIILSTIQKTQPDDRSFETGVINSSQIEVFIGKYLLCFYNFNKNQKPLFGSCLTVSAHQMLVLYFLVKKLLVLFH